MCDRSASAGDHDLCPEGDPAQTLSDHLWREHLVTLDHLRQVIGFPRHMARSAERKLPRPGPSPSSGAADRPAPGGDLTGVMQVELVPPEEQGRSPPSGPSPRRLPSRRDQITGDAPSARRRRGRTTHHLGSGRPRRATLRLGQSTKKLANHGAFVAGATDGRDETGPRRDDGRPFIRAGSPSTRRPPEEGARMNATDLEFRFDFARTAHSRARLKSFATDSRTRRHPLDPPRPRSSPWSPSG